MARWHAGVLLTNGISDLMKEAPQTSVTPPGVWTQERAHPL